MENSQNEVNYLIIYCRFPLWTGEKHPWRELSLPKETVEFTLGEREDEALSNPIIH